MFKKIYFTLLFILIPFLAPAFESYLIDFEGVKSEETLNILKSVSSLISLQDIPPVSDASLKRRAEADVLNFIKALHSLSLYGASVNLKIDFDKDPVHILFTIDEKDVYPLAEFKIIHSKDKENPSYPLENINLSQMGIKLQTPATPSSILQAEEKLLSLMEKAGYPLSTIEKRDVIVDAKAHDVMVTLIVNEGPKVKFGPAIFKGHKRVSEDFLQKKVCWQLGSIYDPSQIERTQIALEQTGLFSTISMENGDINEDSLPIIIEVHETKHRSIGLGSGYATERGFGAAFEWEHRNVRKMGEKLSLKSNIWKDQQEATLLYLIPDFKTPKQDLRFILDYEHQRTRGYSENSYSFATLVERQINEHLRISYGGMYKQLHDTRSDNNRDFNLLKSPLQLKFNNTNSLLDPTDGFSINLKVVPSVQVFRPQFFYTTNTLVSTLYHPLTKDHALSVANKITFGTIMGATHHAIPPSERFYAGSENLLRGYHYLTVSPLNKDNKPTGGRSMLVNSTELRYRCSKTIGLVGFYEIGNVYHSSAPDLKEKMLQSAGFGLRYYTPVGPLRADIAFPLNRRKHLDAPFQFYISIGQAF